MIYFVRHGETDLNKQKIFQGHIDEPLNEVGQNQAKMVAQKLKDEKFDYIFCSPFKRARGTADEINKFHNLEIVEDFRIAETNLGTMQGRSYNQENIDEYFANPKKFGGESFEDVYNRVKSFLDEKKKFKGKNILIVSHSGVNLFVNFYIKNRDIKKDEVEYIPFENCGIMKYEF